MGCEFSSLKQCLKEKSVDEILKAQLKILLKRDWSIGPVVDGYFLPGIKTINLKGHYGTERERPSQLLGSYIIIY